MAESAFAAAYALAEAEEARKVAERERREADRLLKQAAEYEAAIAVLETEKRQLKKLARTAPERELARLYREKQDVHRIAVQLGLSHRRVRARLGPAVLRYAS